ncbi:hypothetical protein AB0J14_35075 [Micromonospora arborensis]
MTVLRLPRKQLCASPPLGGGASAVAVLRGEGDADQDDWGDA